jgi:DNA-directed RNA polymerase specialized sigma subunit
MPKASKSSIKARSSDTIEIYSESLEAWKKKKEISKQAWINRLKECGLDNHEVELILLRFYEESDFKKIVQKCGWVSVDAAAYAYKKAIGKLRRKGFSFG